MSRVPALSSVLATVALTLGAPLAFALSPTAARPETAPRFVQVAEGLTSADWETGIQAAYRWFSVPTFAELCAPLIAPARLALVGVEPVELAQGEWFPYDRLIVVALDESDAVLPPVPMALEVEEVERPLLDLGSTMTAEDRVLAIGEGAFRFRFRTLCERHTAELTVEARVAGP